MNQGDVAKDIERDIRIAIWNAGRWQGKPDEVALSLIRKAMSEPTMVRALENIDRLTRAGETAGGVEEAAKAAFKADFLDHMPDTPETFDFEWAWTESASMPLSGPAFVRQWTAIATAVLQSVRSPKQGSASTPGGDRK